MDLQENFYLIDKTNRVHDVNKKSVSAPKVIAKGHTGLLKFCSVFGLSSVAKFCFMVYGSCKLRENIHIA